MEIFFCFKLFFYIHVRLQLVRFIEGQNPLLLSSGRGRIDYDVIDSKLIEDGAP